MFILALCLKIIEYDMGRSVVNNKISGSFFFKV